MTSSKRTDPLEPVLRDAEEELKRLLREACDAEQSGVSSESTAEIRQLEDTLLAAAVAAKHTVALRHHIRERSKTAERSEHVERDERVDHADHTAPADHSEQAEQVESAPEMIREFRDAEGRMWRAWPVTPGRARTDSHAGRYLGEYHRGWICFETLDSSLRRRLPREQSNWAELTEQELEGLLDEAIAAPPRKGIGADRPAPDARGRHS